MPRQCTRYEIKGANGKTVGYGIVTSSAPRRRRCWACGILGAQLQCDGPAPPGRRGKSKTCDRWLCRGCAQHVGEDTDYCREHASPHAVSR
jgi:hypothetical protein